MILIRRGVPFSPDTGVDAIKDIIRKEKQFRFWTIVDDILVPLSTSITYDANITASRSL